jgi:hypothetical protein
MIGYEFLATDRKTSRYSPGIYFILNAIGIQETDRLTICSLQFDDPK